MNREKAEWFRQARFGMFIHWGLYSIPGRGEWVRYQEDIPQKEYRKFAEQFNPQKYKPSEWAEIAKAAGMKYMVLTTKHHDGFCLFDSQYTDFTSSRTAAGRDLVAEYVEACRNAGLGVGLYFTVKDWSFPAYFRGPEGDPAGFEKLVQYFHNQTLELMTQYGKIDLLFYDGADDANFRGGWGKNTADIWKTAELNHRVRELQPQILINNRSGPEEDYGTPEQQIPNSNNNGNRPSECCITMNNSWGFSYGDSNWKSTGEILRTLTACSARGHNLLLNVGPDRDGMIPQEPVERLREVGLWMKVHGEAIYGAECILPDWWDYTSFGRITTKGNLAYLMIQDWKSDGELVFTALKNQIISAELLATHQKLTIRREGRRHVLSGLPIHTPFPWMNVIKLELDGKPEPQFYY